MFISTLFLLFVAHALCDYPLQGDFLAKGKNHLNPIPNIPWYQCLLAHSLIHAGAVYLITGNLFIGLIELIIHFITDYLKCDNKISFNIDQFTHYFVKIIYAIILIF